MNLLEQLHRLTAEGRDILSDHPLDDASSPSRYVANVANVAVANAGDDGWPEPKPLTAKIEPEPYPLDALPPLIRAAVEEVQEYGQAPVALVASAALSAVSVSCQAHIDIQRDEQLRGPVGLFLLTVAESGERKSSTDGYFSRGIRDYELRQAEMLKPDVDRYKADMRSWESERDGLQSAIRDLGKKGKPTDKLRDDMVHLQEEMPEEPKVPRILLGDETPESLAWSLHRRWPSAGVISSEAGIVFGGHAMGKESLMRNLGLVNSLWDGSDHSVGRRTSESFIVRGARLTMGLQIQPDALREYMARAGTLARGSGFLARFLLAVPRSTQGTRKFREAPPNWPALGEFNRRIAAALEQEPPLAEHGGLVPMVLTLDPAARREWIAFHDTIEAELAPGGELATVKDVASKTADNCARLAALFHHFEGRHGAVGVDAVERASRIVAWHLSEARRFFGEFALPPELADATRLDEWLIDYCQRNETHIVATREAQRLGPIRDRVRLDAAVEVLSELDRAHVRADGRRKTVRVNPALVVTS